MNKNLCLCILLAVLSALKCRGDVCDNKISSIHFTNIAKSLSAVGQASFSPARFINSFDGMMNAIEISMDARTPSTCLLNEKLDEVLEKLVGIGSSIECQSQRTFLRTLNNKIGTLRGLRSQAEINGWEIVESSMKNLCKDHTEGINKIYSDFEQFYFNQSEMTDYAKNCAKYDLKFLDTLLASALSVELLIASCQQAVGSTTFNFQRFNKQLGGFDHYYRDYYLIKQFEDETGEFGLNQAVKRILDKARNAEDAVKTLSNKYHFFDWDVIYYPGTISGLDRHCSIDIRENRRSNHYIANDTGLYGNKTSLVSWHSKEKKYEEVIWRIRLETRYDGRHAQNNTDLVWDANHASRYLDENPLLPIRELDFIPDAVIFLTDAQRVVTLTTTNSTTSTTTTTRTSSATTTTVPATPGLQNHWSFDGSFQDRAGGMDMTIQQNGALTTDRFGNLSSALLLNSGFATVPAGVYFDPATGGFSVMAWLKLSAYANGQAIIDFGNSVNSDNIMFYLYGTTGWGRLAIYNANTGVVESEFSSQPVKIGEWTHLSVSVSGSVAKLYINGAAKGFKTGIEYRKIQRSACYIGRLNPGWSNVRAFQGVIDDLKIFSRGLSQAEIVHEMNRLK